ncbi:TRAP transporter large permease [Vibrio aquaticus]|uniref:TRAP transporter large permease n=1 Tax=Vibrio aquaticus TaxID=2496559 RepID=UPI0026AE39F9
MEIAMMISVWLFTLAIGLPVGFSLIIGSLTYFFVSDQLMLIAFSGFKFIEGLNSFSLLAVPFFTLTGKLMNSSGITDRIFNFSKAMLGHYTGGLGHVNIFASLLFSGMSGSALADAGGLGQLEIKTMRKAGYDDDYNGGLTAASCIIGPLVPPSMPLVMYGIVSNQSISKLFLGGFIPGLIMAICLMFMAYILAKKRGYKPSQKASRTERVYHFKSAFFALLTPIIIIGGIFSGLFTPTEAAVIATVYSMGLGLFIYKELTVKQIFLDFIGAVKISGVVGLMIMGVGFIGQIISREQIAMDVGVFFSSISDEPIISLLLILLALFVLGIFIDSLPLLVLVVPIFVPVVIALGFDPIYFGILTILTLMIGILTPPMGTALFMVSKVGDIPVATVVKGVIPFILPLFATLGILIMFPQLVMFLPEMFG